MTFLVGITEERQIELREILKTRYVANGSCWEWINRRPYPMFQKFRLNRLSFALFKGDFGLKKFICHRCENPKCFNPDHLFEGDQKTNNKDAWDRKRKQLSSSIYDKARNV